jgi:hypothetical protein
LKFDKEIYDLCVGDTVLHVPDNRIGTISNIRFHLHTEDYEVKFLKKSEKLWCKFSDLQLVFPV